MVGIFAFYYKTNIDVPPYKTFPIYDEYGTLVGGFSKDDNGSLRCSISGIGHPCALKITSGDAFYFGVVHKNEHIYGVVSENKINDGQLMVYAAFPIEA